MSFFTESPDPRWTLANVGAIPGTGRYPHSHCFRRPRSVGIKRALLAVAGTLRGLSVPPDSWEDLAISATRDRSWKRHRGTQWRERV